MLSIANALIYLSYFSVLLPIVLLLARKKNFKSRVLNVLGILLLVLALSDLGSFILFKMGKPSITHYNIAVILQFFLVSGIYRVLLNNKKIVYTGAVLFIVFCAINIAFIQPFNEFQSWLFFASSIAFIIYSLMYYWQTLKRSTPIDPFYHYPFWLNSAIFYYFTFNVFLFALTNYVFKHLSAAESIAYWGFHNFNNIVKNILFAIAIIVFKRHGQSPLFKG